MSDPIETAARIMADYRAGREPGEVEDLRECLDAMTKALRAKRLQHAGLTQRVEALERENHELRRAINYHNGARPAHVRRMA